MNWKGTYFVVGATVYSQSIGAGRLPHWERLPIFSYAVMIIMCALSML